MAVACPNCKKGALRLGNGDPVCLVCQYTDSSAEVAVSFAEEFLDYDAHRRDEDSGGPVECWACDAIAALDLGSTAGHGASHKPPVRWVCFDCGDERRDEELSVCVEGDHLFVPPKQDPAAIVCQSHFAEKVASAD